MDIGTMLEYKKVLEDISQLAQEMSSQPFKHKYRLYKWRGNYMLEELDTEKTLCLRNTLEGALRAAHQNAISPREIMIDL